MVKEIESLQEFEKEIRYPGLVVVDFFTTWCGPCKMVAPIIEQFAVKYPDVKFIKVDIEKNEDVAAPRKIQSIPTFHFIVNGNLVDELKGANPTAIEQKINQHKVSTNPFGGSGQKLSSTTGNEMSAREARLKAFGSVEPTRAPIPPPASAAAVTKSSTDDDEDEALRRAMALSIAEQKQTKAPAPAAATGSSAQEAADLAAAEQEFAALEAEHASAAPEIHTKPTNADGEWEEEMVPVPVNSEILEQLMDMGFPDVRARKAIVHGGSLEGALTWLTEHEDDPEIDQPYLVKKSDTIPKAPLTAEEKAKRIEAMKNKIKQRRDDRSKQEKADAIRHEKERRERGQKMDETLEERQRIMRKHEQDKIKREKMEQEKERARLKAEIARDKEIRRANKGVLPSVLGVDGYNPSIIQYDVPGSAPTPSAPPAVPALAAETIKDSLVPAKRGVDGTTAPSAPPAKSMPPAAPKKVSTTSSSSSSSGTDSSPQTPEQRMDAAITTLLRYRTGGDGGQALKLLLTFVKNIADHPEDPKYRSINTESNAFKTKLAPLVGSVLFLKAVGFEKDESDGKLKYNGDVPSALLTVSVQKLTQAEALYRQQNPQ